MKKILYPLKVAWACWYFLIFILFFLLLYPAFAIFLSREKWYKHANALRIVWARILFFFTGIIIRIESHAHLKKDQPYIFVSNHFSYLDIPCSAIAVKRNWRFMAKAELDNIPIFNIFFRTVDISVVRQNARESFKAVHESKESLDKGFDLVIYPEGTIGPHPPQMMRFKNGSFKLAIEKQVPIVPFTMPDNWKLLYVDGWTIYGRPGISRIKIHPAIETRGLTIADLAALKEKVFHLLESDLRKYSVLP